MPTREQYVNTAARLLEQRIGRVLNQFVHLAPSVAALGSGALDVRMLIYEKRVRSIGGQTPLGLASHVIADLACETLTAKPPSVTRV